MVLRNKKLWKIIGIFLAVIVVLVTGYKVSTKVYDYKYLQYCTKINELVNDYTFSWIEIKPGVIELGLSLIHIFLSFLVLPKPNTL